MFIESACWKQDLKTFYQHLLSNSFHHSTIQDDSLINVFYFHQIEAEIRLDNQAKLHSFQILGGTLSSSTGAYILENLTA